MSANRSCTEGADFPTPKTDALAKRFAKDCGIGGGKIDPEEMMKMLWEHAREMERLAHTYRVVAVAEMKP